MDWMTWIIPGGVALIAAAGIGSLWDRLEKRAADIAYMRAIMKDLRSAVGGFEPVRKDANDPLRDRFIFCGRWVDSCRHAPNCPWSAMDREMLGLSRVRPFVNAIDDAATGSAGEGER